MAVDLLHDKGVPLARQSFTWRDLVRPPPGKLDADAFSRVRALFLGSLEAEAVRFGHACSRVYFELQRPLAEVRRIEHHQRTLLSFLLSPDHSPLETVIALEQTAVEVQAAAAQREPDRYLAQVYRFGILEDLDHLYRCAAVLDRLYGQDANQILQSQTDVLPGRATSRSHRAPADDHRRSYDRARATPLTKLQVRLVTAPSQRLQDAYLNLGPLLADPAVRQLFAELASIEEQHVTSYSALADPTESWLEKWVLHEAAEVWCYESCLEEERDPALRELWERFLGYELGHLRAAIDQLERHERRDAAEFLPAKLPERFRLEGHRKLVRELLGQEAELCAVGTEFVEREPKDGASVLYRRRLNAEGSPSEAVGAGYRFVPGTELTLATRTRRQEGRPS